MVGGGEGRGRLQEHDRRRSIARASRKGCGDGLHRGRATTSRRAALSGLGAWGRGEDRRESPFDTKASAQRPVRKRQAPDGDRFARRLWLYAATIKKRKL